VVAAGTPQTQSGLGGLAAGWVVVSEPGSEGQIDLALGLQEGVAELASQVPAPLGGLLTFGGLAKQTKGLGLDTQRTRLAREVAGGFGQAQRRGRVGHDVGKAAKAEVDLRAAVAQVELEVGGQAGLGQGFVIGREGAGVVVGEAELVGGG